MHVEPVYASYLGAGDSSHTESADAVDGIVYLLGDHGRSMGGSAEHRKERVCQAE
jgi:hypothetical protein